jgi:hypothetical protein
MAFDSINGILGTGGRKTACRGKQWGNQELISPDQGKKKISAAFLQKIFHKFTFSCISSSRSLYFLGYKTLKGNNVFLLQRQAASIQQADDSFCHVRRLFQFKTFPHRNNDIHGR